MDGVTEAINIIKAEEDDDIRAILIDNLAVEPLNSEREVNVILYILIAMEQDTSPLVRVSVCEALIRCVRQSSRLDPETVKGTKKVAHYLLGKLRWVDKDARVRDKAKEGLAAIR